VWDVNVNVLDAWIENGAGERVTNVEQGEPIVLRIRLQARRDLEAPVFGIHFLDENANTVFGFNRTLERAEGAPDRVPAGGHFRIGGAVQNPLRPGRYFVNCYIARNRTQGDYALHFVRMLDFVVYGTDAGPGSVAVEADVQAEIEP
jgi:hypothetical protein